MGIIQVEHRASDGSLRLGLVDLRGLSALAEHQVLLDFVRDAGWVSGVVEDHNRRGVAGLGLSFETRESPAHFEANSHTLFESFVRTDRHGRFRIQLPLDGTHRVRSTSMDLGGAFVDEVVAGSEVLLAARGRSNVRGRLRAVGARGGADLNLLLLREQYAVAETRWSGRTLGCSCDGEFEFPDVVHGRYTLIVRRVIDGAPPQELARIERLDVNVHGVFDVGEVLVSD